MELNRSEIQPTVPGTSGARRSPGRPRSDGAHASILTSAIALVREIGYDAVTMDAIAARAGVGKATIYRRWKEKETLVAEAVGRILSVVPIPDTGSVEEDLLALMLSNVRMYRDPATGPLLSGLVAAMARSERIAGAVRTGFVATRRVAVRTVLRRGIARGELRPDANVEVAMDLLGGALVYRFLVTGEPVDEALARAVVELVLRGMAGG